MMLQNWQRSSSRRKVATFTMSPAFAVIVSSPCATRWSLTEPGSAPAIISPSLSSVSSMAQNPSALDRAGAADLLLQQQHAVEQRFGGRRGAGDGDDDRHDAGAAPPGGIAR